MTEIDLDMTEANFDGLVLLEAEMPGADFRGSSLKRVDFAYSLLAAAKFNGCDMTDAIIPKANVDYADLTRATLTRARLFRSTFNEASLLHANLMNAELGGCHLAGADLSGADLRGCVFGRVAFDETKLVGADLRGATGFEDGSIGSIDVGHVLRGEDARAWLIDAAAA